MNSITKYLGLVWLGCSLLAPSLFGQAGNDNPGGVTAEFHGNITTAGNYDPYTGNARREIDDIVVPGAIGAYPLKYTRTMNTRSHISWTNNYTWGVSLYYPYYHPGGCGTDIRYCDSLGTVNYPSGGGTFELLEPYPGEPWHLDANGRNGADDLLFDCTKPGSQCTAGARFEIWRADGGKVLFEAAGSFSSRASAIIDPYGQQTTLTYNGSGQLWKVTEPGGRYLEFIYNQGALSMVQANDGQGHIMESVQYGWANGVEHVYYDDGAVATYTYVTPNNYVPPDQVDPNRPAYANLIHSCDDPRYPGPMKYIEYEYVSYTEVPDVARGQIQAEKNILGQRVSSTTYPAAYANPTADPNYYRRTETRGDGQTRSIYYAFNPAPNVYGMSWTDFKNHSSSDQNLPNRDGWTTTNARQNETRYDTEDVIGALAKITYPQTEPGASPATKEYTFTNTQKPYFHSGEKDENGDWTYFVRDDYNRVTTITHPDHSTEEFTYNNFGQVLTHKLRTGGTESFGYDTRGLKTSYTPPATESDPNPGAHPTIYTYYQASDGHPTWIDRPRSVTDPRQNTTWFYYNNRGQVTMTVHQDSTYTQSAYNLDGTLAWTADENHPNAGLSGHESERTRYTYDQYKRVLTVTLPGETLPTTNYYGLDWANPLLHTTNTLKYTLSPLNQNVVYDYDANLRKIAQTVAANTSGVATTWFEYDEVGNLIKTTDPRGKETAFAYDQRNRKISMDNPIATDRNIHGHTMEWQYDGVGNKLKETRADDAFRLWEYEVSNRITRAIDWRASESEPRVVTTCERDLPSGTGALIVTRERTKDGKNAIYEFTFDAQHRKISETYPPAYNNASPNEHFWYDIAGNLSDYRNPAGQTKHLSYDNRNRLLAASWDNNVAPITVTAYDAASRVTSVETPETAVHFGYNDANRVIFEDQILAGYPTRRIEKGPDADGNPTKLSVKTNTVSDFLVYYGFTQRNQLAQITQADNSPFFTYEYDSAGNVTRRHGPSIGDSLNVPSASYDPLNRPTYWENTRGGDVWFSRTHYQFDKVGREVAVWRDEDGNKGERYWFNTSNHLMRAAYKADNVWTATPANIVTDQVYAYTADMLNRASVSENGVVTNYASTPNGLNQYTTVGGTSVQYDGNFNLSAFGTATATYNANNQLTSLNSGATAAFVYDGLGRCVKRTVNGVSTLFAYDGWKPVVEYDGAGNRQAQNIYGPGADEILGRGSGYGWFFYHTDKQGSVTALVDLNGNVVEKYTYDAFGKPTILSTTNSQLSTSAVGNRFMFTGREWIPELNLYDYRNRFYFPLIGRFLQTDPTGFDAGDMDLFRYCHDDPVDMSDPTGLFDLWGGLHDYFTGNPSMNLIQGAWGEQFQVLNVAFAGLAARMNAARIDKAIKNGPSVIWEDTGNEHLKQPFVYSDEGSRLLGRTFTDISATGESYKGKLVALYVKHNVDVVYATTPGDKSREFALQREPTHRNELRAWGLDSGRDLAQGIARKLRNDAQAATNEADASLKNELRNQARLSHQLHDMPPPIGLSDHISPFPYEK